jgi:hypothetical protein
MNDLLGTVKKGGESELYASPGPDVEEGFAPPPSEQEEAMKVGQTPGP